MHQFSYSSQSPTNSSDVYLFSYIIKYTWRHSLSACISTYEWVCFDSPNKIIRFNECVWRSCYNHSVQFCIMKSSSNKLIRHSIHYIGVLDDQLCIFSTKTRSSDLQNKMRTLCLLKFTVFCVLRLLFLLSLPFPSLDSHLPEGGWGNRASALPHCTGKKQVEKGSLQNIAVLQDINMARVSHYFVQNLSQKRKICYLLTLALGWSNSMDAHITSNRCNLDVELNAMQLMLHSVHGQKKSQWFSVLEMKC